jgi:glyoxylase-like metal-dependent hydrolase (beta-lactamase superfamily II)
MPDAPAARTARFDVLVTGSPGPNVVSTCTLVRDGSVAAVVDPGLAPSQDAILEPLRELGLDASEVTDVVMSHHHPDHALNVALFPRARVHDHWAIYDFAGRWDDVDCEGRILAPSIHLIRSAGHSNEDLSTVAGTPEGVVVLTHLWWTDTSPVEDPYAPDPDVLHTSRAHGAPFRPSETTPR